uniref:NADH-ubiquinone oxidoreductase chain 4 n=1 Tax=Oxyopes hupingensis TaxID=2713554 RepID=A0A6G6D9W6_9ARAC|nr:NADH dehydrogenase subunit 4 [Oxyopes hupingensis]QIE13337.1 NADH dehydrogenase subunit 4 [Oxyopes hupingensis]
MLKIIIPLSLIFLNKIYLPSITLFLISLLMLMMILNFNSNIMMFNNMMFQDKLSFILMMLSLISVMLIIISSSNLKNIFTTIFPILIILMLTFLISNIIMFYILFELVLIPTMMLIMKMSKQQERLQASIYLMMYTITASLPLLINMILLKNNYSFSTLNISMLKLNMIIMFMLAFLVKTPMFFTHLWLPKAHVEAPLEGSMILAAMLLKLGGYGLIRFLPMCIKKMNSLSNWIISISFIGACMTSMNCIRQKDLKSLIAYSSVAHMGFVLLGLFSMMKMGLMGAILMMIAHGLSSSALFLLTNDLYFKHHSRNIMLFKGMISISPNITFWWFMFSMINISAPPTINTMSEIFIMMSTLIWNKMTLIMIFISSIMVTSFSMMMYLNISHNKSNTLFLIQTPHKIFLSLFIHLTPLIILIMKMEMLI